MGLKSSSEREQVVGILLQLPVAELELMVASQTKFLQRFQEALKALGA